MPPSIASTSKPKLSVSEGAGQGTRLLIDSGANPKAIETFLRHSKIQTTFETCGHLMPGSHDEVRARMDAYLAMQPEPRVALRG
jgi:hypothetical protein